jgi:hypothetical protein
MYSISQYSISIATYRLSVLQNRMCMSNYTEKSQD